jgi:LPXTG-motif cell wall-anchored protein
MTRTTARAVVRALAAGATIAALTVLGVVAVPMAASAATFTVTTLADSGAGSLRDAVDQANLAPGADTITFDPAIPANSIIAIVGPIDVSDALTIDGSAVAGLTLAPGSNGTYPLLYVAPDGAGQSFEFSNFIIDGTAVQPAWTGIAIYVSYLAPNNAAVGITLDTMTERNLTGNEGPALYVFAMAPTGTVTITDSTFTDNSSPGGNGGGAVYFRGVNSAISISGSTFANNSANLDGGAMFIDGTGGGTPTLTITGSLFSDNSAGRFGGAIMTNLIASLGIDGTQFLRNAGGLAGGAVVATPQDADSVVVVTRSSFLDNSADFAGGGLVLLNNVGTTLVDRSTFARNLLSSNPAVSALGNSILISGSTDAQVTIQSSTFDEQSASGQSTYAIALARLSGLDTFDVNNSTIVGAGGIIIQSLENNLASIDHTIISSTGTVGDALTVTNRLLGTEQLAVDWSLSSGSAQPYLSATNTVFDVSNFGLGVLADNGGPTMTRLPSAASPAHNAGDPAAASAPATDQRGLARVVERIDIGAVEVQALTVAALAATGVSISPLVPIGAGILLLVGIAAVLLGRRRRRA